MRVFKFLAHLKRSEGSGTATELIVVRRMYPLLLQLAAYQFAYLDASHAPPEHQLDFPVL